MRMLLLAALAMVSVSGEAARANLISNGDFATGNFADWTIADYGVDGGTGEGGLTGNQLNEPGAGNFPSITPYDVTGSGVQVAATFQVGLTSDTYGGAARGGASLSQQFSAPGGTVGFSASIATSGLGDYDDGQFDVLISGVEIASYAFGGSPGNGVTLAGTEFLSPGTYFLEIAISRDYANSPGTPLQYITNIELDNGPAAVPEPSPLAVVGAAFAGLAAVRRRRWLA